MKGKNWLRGTTGEGEGLLKRNFYDCKIRSDVTQCDCSVQFSPFTDWFAAET